MFRREACHVYEKFYINKVALPRRVARASQEACVSWEVLWLSGWLLWPLTPCDRSAYKKLLGQLGESGQAEMVSLDED